VPYKCVILKEGIREHKDKGHKHILRTDSSRLTEKCKNYRKDERNFTVLPIAYFLIAFFGLCQPVRTLVAGEYCYMVSIAKFPAGKMAG
jgi:hypothetical protein